MKWLLIVWWMVGPVDGALTDMETRHFSYEFSTQEKCYAALREAREKLEEIENLRGAALQCESHDFAAR